MAVEIGQEAPGFSMYDQDLSERSLEEFKGKSVVLAFYPGAFTGVCTTEMCVLRDQAAEFNSLNAQVLGISVDPPFAQNNWADANNLNFPVLSDYNREVVTQYDVAFPDLGGLRCGEPGGVHRGQGRGRALQMARALPCRRARLRRGPAGPGSIVRLAGAAVQA